MHAGALEALIEQESPALVLLGHTIDSLGFGAGGGGASSGSASPAT